MISGQNEPWLGPAEENVKIQEWITLAEQQIEAAGVLVAHQDERFFIHSIYLAGYATEFALKALVLTQVQPEAREKFEAIHLKRGAGHDLEKILFVMLRSGPANCVTNSKRRRKTRPKPTFMMSRLWSTGRRGVLNDDKLKRNDR